jgi:hypothetical protein
MAVVVVDRQAQEAALTPVIQNWAALGVLLAMLVMLGFGMAVVAVVASRAERLFGVAVVAVVGGT